MAIDVGLFVYLFADITYIGLIQVLEVTQEAWPECVNQHLTAGDCKDFIDQYIYENFTERDRYTRTLVKGKRAKTDHYYNVVVILMNDGDMVEGRDHDGQVQYDW